MNGVRFDLRDGANTAAIIRAELERKGQPLPLDHSDNEKTRAQLMEYAPRLKEIPDGFFRVDAYTGTHVMVIPGRFSSLGDGMIELVRGEPISWDAAQNKDGVPGQEIPYLPELPRGYRYTVFDEQPTHAAYIGKGWELARLVKYG